MSSMKQMPQWDWTCKIFMEKMLIKTKSVCMCRRRGGGSRGGKGGFPGGPVARINLAMQGTLVRSLVWEDPTCCGVTESMGHNK